MKRNHQFSMLLLTLGLAGTSLLQAQPLVGSGGPGRPGPAKLAGPRPAKPSGIVALTTLSGTVQQFTANDESIVDGFTFNTGSQTLKVQFPSRLGQAIQAAGKSGKSVTIAGSSEVTPEGDSIFRLVSLTDGQTVVTDTPPNPAVSLAAPTPVTVKGKVVSYRLDKQGQVKGLQLSDQTVVRVPPHAAAQLMTIAPKESTISVEGFLRPAVEGQVILQKQTIVEASLITVNGQSFLVR